MTLISIVIPIYNAEKYLKETVDSVISQTHKEWECIMIDDGSEDGSSIIAQDYCKMDNRIKYYRQQNAGPSVARNHGVKLAKGDYIQFLDADDVMLQTRLADLLKLYNLKSSNCVLFSNLYLGDQDDIYKTSEMNRPASCGDKMLFRDIYAYFGIKFLITPTCILFPRACFDNCNWDVTLSHSEDWELYLKLAKSGWEFEYIPEKLVIYRNNPAGLSKNRYKTIHADLKILDRYKFKGVRSVYYKRAALLLKKSFFNFLLKGDKLLIKPTYTGKIVDKLTANAIIYTLTIWYIFGGIFEIIGKRMKHEV